MKTIDLKKERHDLGEILSMARADNLLVRSESGEDFVIERADEFEREVSVLGNNPKFMSLLEERSKQEDRPLSTVREEREL